MQPDVTVTTDDDGSPPVLIVGAGPVGLSLACSLRRLGVACRVVDADDGPTPERESRALGLQARTLEIFEALGLAEPLLAGGLRLRGAIAYRGRRPRFRVDLEGLEGVTAFPFILSIPQGATERALIDRLATLGVVVEWQTQLSELRQDDSGVEAVLIGTDGRATEARAGWLVGCDGARSTTRAALGLGFEGTSYPERFLLADVVLDWDLPRDHAHLLITPEGVIPALPLPGERAWRLIDTSGRLESDDPGAIVDRFARLLHEHAPGARPRLGEATWTSAFRIHRRAVDRLRVGRCLMAGDAAHIHSPAGGQGLNTGVQDADNLAWKLALVIRGEASASLLDSYDAERRPVAESVLAATDRATRLVTLRNPIARWARDLAMAAVLAVPAVRRRLARAVADLEVTYRDGPLSSEDWPPHPLDPPTGSPGPRPGDRLPDVPLGPDRRLHDIARGPWFTVLLFTGTESSTADVAVAMRAVLDLIAGRFADRVAAIAVVGPGSPPFEATRGVSATIDDPDARLHRRFGTPGPGLYLIRPDRHIASRSRPPDAGRLERALGQFLSLDDSTRDDAS